MAILDTLLLTAAVPVAKEAASAAVETLSAASSGFASLLRGEASSSDAAAGATESDGQFLSAEELVKGFRSWLESNGIAGELDLDISVRPGEQLHFSGADADRIADLVGSEPRWNQHFSQLAQQVSSALGSGPTPATISLSGSTWAVSLTDSPREN